jgi:protein TonB
MAVPLRSANPGPADSIQFKHFGILDTGGQSNASTATSLVVNLLIAFVAIVISMATTQTIQNSQKIATLIEAPVPKPVETPKPKIIPPKIKMPPIAKVEPPKITVPQVRAPELPKQPVIKMEQPKPLLAPAPPKQIVAMAAPKVVNLGHPQAASVVNHDAHPTAVRLGSSDSPISNLHGPAVAPVNLARGMPGVNSANTGNGPAATKVNLGNGSPGGTSIHGNGVVAVAGIPHGVPGGTGPLNSTGRVAGPVNLGQNEPPAQARQASLASAPQIKAPKVIYKPKPVYTEEAIAKHVEGVVSVHIRVLQNGSVEVLSVTKPLGYGLDDSARRAIMATKFEPATDASGHPVVWDGVVNVAFELAG